MDVITRDELKTLLVKARFPAVSFYLPTHRGGAEADPIGWRNLLGQADKQLVERGLAAAQARELLGPARYLLDDAAFWKTQSDGLAFFVCPGVVGAFRLPMTFASQALVGERFHIKPLLPLLASDGRFYVLAVSQNHVRLYQGTAHSLHEVDLKGVPTSLAQALQFHDRDEPLMFHGRPTSGGTWGAIFHGQGVGIDDHKDDLLRYFQAVDRGLHALLREERAPLVLASVEYLWPIYRRANTYAHLVEKGVPGTPDRLSAQQLHEQAWAVVRPVVEQSRRQAAALFAQLAGTGRTSAELDEVVRSAYWGQVEILFVAVGKEVWGTVSPASGQVTVHAKPEPSDEDLLNLAAVHVLMHGGTVHAVRPDEVPGRGLAAAVFWLPLARKQEVLRS
jgi:hypothetical protein